MERKALFQLAQTTKGRALMNMNEDVIHGQKGLVQALWYTSPHPSGRIAPPRQLLKLVPRPMCLAVVQEDTDATVAKIRFEAAEAAQKIHMDRVHSLLSDDVIASICRPATADSATPVGTEMTGVR